MWVDVPEWAKNVKILCPMWMLTKGWPQQRKILIIKWIGWLVLWILVSFPSHLCHHPMGSWTRWPWWQDWRPGLSNKDFYSAVLTWLRSPLSALSDTSTKPYWVPNVAPLPNHGRNSVLLLLKHTFPFKTDLPSLHTMLLPKLPSVDLKNSLSTPMLYHTELLLIKEPPS